MIQLGTCIPLRSRISQRQCNINRHGLPHAPGRPSVLACFACKECDGLLDIDHVEYRPIPELEKPAIGPLSSNITMVVPIPTATPDLEETTKMPKRGDCPTCERKDVAMAGPKCPRCYDRIKNGLDPITGEPAGASVPAASPPAATPPILSEEPTKRKYTRREGVNSRSLNENPNELEELFVDDAGLLQQITEAARSNRRTVVNEILWRLEQSLEAA